MSDATRLETLLDRHPEAIVSAEQYQATKREKAAGDRRFGWLLVAVVVALLLVLQTLGAGWGSGGHHGGPDDGRTCDYRIATDC